MTERDINPACFNCTSYPFDCDGVGPGLPVAGCITVPTNTTYYSAMIDDRDDLDDDYECDQAPACLVDLERVSKRPVHRGRECEHPAAPGRDSDASPAAKSAGSPAGSLLARGPRPFGSFVLDSQHEHHFKDIS